VPKFGDSIPYNLTEAGQVNSLRWEMLFREEDGDTYTPQTAIFKCKDYFNDIVALYHGHTGRAYGLNTAKVKVNPEGLYLRLYYVDNKDDVFVNNLEKVLNTELAKSLDVVVNLKPLDNNQFLLFLPRKLFDSTYYISLASYIIRLCNYGIAYESLEALSKAAKQEPEYFCPTVKKWKFDIPEGLKEYWYYSSDGFDSKKEPTAPMTIIHNNGINAITTYYKEPKCAAIAATTC